MRIVLFESQKGDAIDFYRAESPISTMYRFGMCEYIKMGVDELPRLINTKDTSKLQYIEYADLFVVNRLADTRLITAIRGINPRGKIVADYDDNPFEVSPLSPHYETHGVKEVRYKMPDGTVLDLWVSIDKKEKFKGSKQKPRYIDIPANQKNLDSIRSVAESVDLVTVTTDILKEVFEPMAKSVRVLPNCINKNVWKPLDLKKTDEIRMGWFGGYSHYEDWSILTSILPKVMDKHQNLKLVLMGYMFNGTLKDVPKERIEFHPWVGREAFPYKAMTLNLDFALIPLQKTAFNRCKSPIKFVEMASMGVPTVGSYVSPYKEIATEGNGVWVQDNDPKAWEDGIDLMASDAGMRKAVASEAMQTVMSDFEIHGQFHRWAKAYKGVLNGVSNTADSVVNRS